MAQGRIWVKNRKILDKFTERPPNPVVKTELDDLNLLLTLALENICHENGVPSLHMMAIN